MAQDRQRPLNGWKWAFLPAIWPLYQISTQKYDQTFDIFLKNFHVNTDSVAKLGAWHICIYGSRPSDPSKWVKMGVFTHNLTKYGQSLTLIPIVGPTCGSTFYSFHQIWCFMTDSYTKCGARHICAYGLIPSDPFKWVKMGVFTCNLTIIPNLRSKMWADLWHFSKKFLCQHYFWCKNRCLTYLYLWLKTLRPL